MTKPTHMQSQHKNHKWSLKNQSNGIIRIRYLINSTSQRQNEIPEFIEKRSPDNVRRAEVPFCHDVLSIAGSFLFFKYIYSFLLHQMQICSASHRNGETTVCNPVCIQALACDLVCIYAVHVHMKFTGAVLRAVHRQYDLRDGVDGGDVALAVD